MHLNLNDRDCGIGNERALVDVLRVPTCDLGTLTIWIYFVIECDSVRKQNCLDDNEPARLP